MIVKLHDAEYNRRLFDLFGTEIVDHHRSSKGRYWRFRLFVVELKFVTVYVAISLEKMSCIFVFSFEGAQENGFGISLILQYFLGILGFGVFFAAVWLLVVGCWLSSADC
jgi:hypothetical protein